MNDIDHVQAIYVEGGTTGRWYRWLPGTLTVNIFPERFRPGLGVLDVFTMDADRGSDVEIEAVLDSIERREGCAAGRHQVIRDGTCTSCGEPAEPSPE